MLMVSKNDLQQILSFLKDCYPLTVIADRYHGAYSHAVYLAFPLTYTNMPKEPEGNDRVCCEFWNKEDELDYFVGKGESPNDAIKNLIHKYSCQYEAIGGLVEELCEVIGHDLRYNFPSTPSKCICKRCHKKFIADYSGDIIHGDIWKEVKSFNNEERSDESLCNVWHI